ncbi:MULTISPECIES: hypothetical protein [Halomonadaceae]|uniref:DUF4136 domain-containing protein n=1 Tax=Modicisalibacter zincidurans TaxID=1178777 RepID=A0ABP9R667_9GAMM|nr:MULTISPECIES: hypothetical protein [Halomonas]MCD6008645.1 hypothetical protein [Halomonas sp. IOP_31]
MTSGLRVLAVIVSLVLAGCQSGPGPLAAGASASLPAACSWPRRSEASVQTWVRAGIAELEARGFDIRNADLALGVVSAERRTRQPGRGAVDRPWYDGISFWGGSHRRAASGFGLGFGVGGGFDDPVQIERVSLVVGDQTIKLTRDSSVIDAGGYVLDARAYNRDAFCRQVSGAIESRLLNMPEAS